jgi:hypothetical protein
MVEAAMGFEAIWLRGLLAGLLILLGAFANARGERELSLIATAMAFSVLWFAIGDAFVSRGAVMTSTLWMFGAVNAWLLYWIFRFKRRDRVADGS